jgi:hypothetical protein
MNQYRILFHWPLPLAVVSIVTFGAILAPHIIIQRLLLTYLMILFGLVLGAYSIDALKSDWKFLIKDIPEKFLKILALIGVLGFLSIALYETFTISLTGIVPTILIAASVVLYNSNNKYLHNKYGFALTWGSLISISSYYYQTLSLNIILIPLALASFLIAMQEWYTTNTKSPAQLAIGVIPKMLPQRKILRKETFRMTSLMCYSNFVLAITILMWRLI